MAVGDEDGVIGLDDDEVIDAEEGDAGVFAGVEDDVVLGFDLGDFVVGLVSVFNHGSFEEWAKRVI